MQRARTVLVLLLAAAGVVVVGRLFLSQLGTSRPSGEASAVPFTAPPAFDVEDAGELDRAAAAARLAATLAAPDPPPRFGLHFTADGSELYWLVDRSDGDGRLVERAAGPTGTRLETVWTGQVADRLRWAAANGSLEAPGLPAGTTHNLYH